MQSYTKMGKQGSTNGQIKKTRAHPNEKSKDHAKMKGNKITKKHDEVQTMKRIRNNKLIKRQHHTQNENTGNKM